METDDIRSQIARSILLYLLQHPSAGDTIDGICDWWISAELREIGQSLTEGVIASLLKENLLEIHRVEGGAPFYCINKGSVPKIKAFLGL